MTILDSVKGTVNTAVDTISSVAQTIVEKNRTNAKLNRLRLVMKSESELMNRAYIALGKVMYDSRKKGTEINDAECEKLLKVIDTSKAKIAKARECYRKIVNSSNDIFYGNPEVAPEVKEDDIVDITVACSNEGDYKSSPFKEEKPVEKQPEAVTEEKAEPEQAKDLPISAGFSAFLRYIKVGTMLRFAFEGKLYAVDYTLCPLCVLNFCDKNGKIHQR